MLTMKVATTDRNKKLIGVHINQDQEVYVLDKDLYILIVFIGVELKNSDIVLEDFHKKVEELKDYIKNNLFFVARLLPEQTIVLSKTIDYTKT